MPYLAVAFLILLVRARRRRGRGGRRIPPTPVVADGVPRSTACATRTAGRSTAQTGDVYVGDVGGINEEVTYIPRGELRRRQPRLELLLRHGGQQTGCTPAGNYVAPTYEYRSGPDVVIGGYVVRDPSLPVVRRPLPVRPLRQREHRRRSAPTLPRRPSTRGSTCRACPASARTARAICTRRRSAAGCTGSVRAAGSSAKTPASAAFDAAAWRWRPRRATTNELFIAEKAGRVERWTPSGTSEVLDIRDLVEDGGEQGLLSVAVSPDYATSGRLFIFYMDNGGRLQVGELARTRDAHTGADGPARPGRRTTTAASCCSVPTERSTCRPATAARRATPRATRRTRTRCSGRSSRIDGARPVRRAHRRRRCTPRISGAREAAPARAARCAAWWRLRALQRGLRGPWPARRCGSAAGSCLLRRSDPSTAPASAASVRPRQRRPRAPLELRCGVAAAPKVSGATGDRRRREPLRPGPADARAAVAALGHAVRQDVTAWRSSRSLQADMTTLEVDAIANAANTELTHGGGVAAAISRAGGPEVQRESYERAPIGLGEAVETTAGDMPAALGHPRGDDGARRADLGGDHRAGHALDAREGGGARRRSLALVAFGTGVGGFPLDEAARIMVGAAREHDGRPRADRVRGARGRRGASVPRRPLTPAGARRAGLLQGHLLGARGGGGGRRGPALRGPRGARAARGRRRRGHHGRARDRARRRGADGHGVAIRSGGRSRRASRCCPTARPWSRRRRRAGSAWSTRASATPGRPRRAARAS